jgi:hypothetical protein
MALSHIVLSLPAATKTALFTVPSKTISCHVTIQNRDTAASLAIGDATLGGVTGINAGIHLPLAASANAPTTLQFWMNPGDVLYGYASAIMTNSCIVLYSSQTITNPNYAPPVA